MWFSLRKGNDWGHKGGFQNASATANGIWLGDSVCAHFLTELHT